MDAMKEALKRKMNMMKGKQSEENRNAHGDLTEEREEVPLTEDGVSMNEHDPDRDLSDHAPEIEALDKEDEHTPESALNDGASDPEDDGSKNHLDILKSVLKGHTPPNGRKPMGLHEKAMAGAHARYQAMKK